MTKLNNKLTIGQEIKECSKGIELARKFKTKTKEIYLSGYKDALSRVLRDLSFEEKIN